MQRDEHHFPVLSSYSFQRHDQHRIRVFPEFHQIRQAANDAAVRSLPERRLVDRTVITVKLVTGMDQFPACLVAVGSLANQALD